MCPPCDTDGYRRWCVQVDERVGRVIATDDETLEVAEFISGYTGAAREWLEDNRGRYPDALSLSRGMKARFDPQGTPGEVVRSWFSCRQEPGEAVTLFVARFGAVARRLQAREMALEVAIVASFHHGLRREVQSQVLSPEAWGACLLPEYCAYVVDQAGSTKGYYERYALELASSSRPLTKQAFFRCLRYGLCCYCRKRGHRMYSCERWARNRNL